MRKKVIVVEDDEAINTLVTYNLEHDGFAVTSVYDGETARNRLAVEHFDIVVLDIMLPGVDGFTLCRELKDKPDAFNSFVIVISARGSVQDKVYAHILGADCYFSKPFSVVQLREIARDMADMIDREFSTEKQHS